MTSYHTAHLVDDPRRATVWKAVADHLAAYVTENAHVLELGAGYCHWINHVRAARRVAVDRWTELPSHAGEGVEPLVLDISDGLESLSNESFDVVLASNVLEHFLAGCGGCGGEDRRAPAQAGWTFYRDPAELQIFVALVFRRLHAPIDLHGCVAAGAPPYGRIRHRDGRAPLSSVFNAGHVRAGGRLARQGVSSFAAQAGCGPDARRQPKNG